MNNNKKRFCTKKEAIKKTKTSLVPVAHASLDIQSARPYLDKTITCHQKGLVEWLKV
jgi:hypothetical protein